MEVRIIVSYGNHLNVFYLEFQFYIYPLEQNCMAEYIDGYVEIW